MTQNTDAAYSGVPTLAYSTPGHPHSTKSIQFFRVVFWLVGGLFVLALYFGGGVIRQSQAHVLQFSAFVWVAAAVLGMTRHRLHLVAASAWTLSLLLSIVIWIVGNYAAMLLFPPAGLAILAIVGVLGAALAIAIRFRLWRVCPA